MQIKTLNGETKTIKLKNKRLRDKDKSKSIFQYEIGQQLLEKYPHDIIYEEVIIPDGFILDFFIPSLRLVVECNGRQHSQHIRFFHKTKQDFHKQQMIDQKKRDWCKINNFRLIEIDYE